MSGLPLLLEQVRACTVCRAHLPLGPRPVLQADARARILIAGQAPGRRVHETGIPFNDVSGDRLREWMGVDCETFYDASRVAILPMGFCFPGTGTNGDLPPRPECAPQWRGALLDELPSIELTIVLGRYAQAFHLGRAYDSVTEAVRDWCTTWPAVVPMPHPSPRNQRWLKENPWFEREVLPAVQKRISSLLCG